MRQMESSQLGQVSTRFQLVNPVEAVLVSVVRSSSIGGGIGGRKLFKRSGISESC